MKNSIKCIGAILMTVSMMGLTACSMIEKESGMETESVIVEESHPEETEKKTYVIEYYADDDATTPSDQTTEAISGVDTNLIRTEDLGFSKDGYEFLGWKIYRDSDNTWFVNATNGKTEWVSAADNGELPDGYTYALRNDGGKLHAPTESGIVKLYAEWGAEYNIEYYENADSTYPLEKTSVGVIGKKTKLLTVEELEIETEGRTFEGWRLNRDEDDKWFVKNSDGESEWYDLEGGELPEDYEYVLKKDGEFVYAPVSEGTLRLYAEWADE